ncbi:MAG TPA: TetR/AcrR family transcriptional regulator [Longimicrobiales bacterium]|nr:TetR/AcrR family transcriptional regulator [Longimicrobiales bacterium]
MSGKAARTRERILDAAQALVLERGFAATSVDDIQKAAGISRGTFFYHFPSKDALARALLARYAGEDHELVESTMRRAEKLAKDPLQQALVFMGLFEELFRDVGPDRSGCLFASYSYEAGLFDEETHRTITASMEHFRQVLGDKLKEAMQRHPTVPRDVDPYALADVASSAFQGAYVLWRVYGDRDSIAVPIQHFRTYLELVFGIAEADAEESGAKEPARRLRASAG